MHVTVNVWTVTYNAVSYTHLDRRGANGSVETNNRFGELQNYNPNTIGLFFEEGIKEIGGLTQLNALDNRGGDWAGYININVDVPKTDTYELSFLTIGGSGRKLEATIDGVSTGIFDVINDKSSPHAYSCLLYTSRCV